MTAQRAPWAPPEPIRLASVSLGKWPGVIDLVDQEGATWQARQMSNGTIELGRSVVLVDAGAAAGYAVTLFVPFQPYGIPSLLEVAQL